MTDIMEVARIYLAVFYSVVAFFYTTRIILMKRSLKKDLVFPGERYCVNWWNHTIFRFFRALIWGVCLLRLFFPNMDYYLGIFNTLYTPNIILAGLIILTLGFTLTIIIHFKMGKLWSSGIDPNGPQRLIQSGFYRYTRNPMFCSVALSQLGYFLALPSCFSATCLLVGIYILDSQAKEEEKHLMKVHPTKYSHYTNQVRRWL